MIYSSDLNGYSASEIVRLLGRQLKEYRLRCGMTQSDMATKVGISIRTITGLETGAATNITLVKFILLLQAVGRSTAMMDLLPELPADLYSSSATSAPKQRVKHKKK